MKFISLLLFFWIFYDAAAQIKDSCSAATEHYMKGKYKETIIASTVCINSEKDNNRLLLAYAFRSDAYERNKQYELALADVTKVIALSPESGNFCSRAAIYQKMKKYDFALKDYDAAIQKLPDNYVNYYFKGRCLLAAKKYAEASSVLYTCLNMQPQYAQASALLAAIALEQNDLKTSQEHIKTALKNNNGAYEPNYYAGLLEMKLGNFRAALQQLNEAEKNDWTKPEVFFKKATCYAWLNRTDSARLNLEKVKKMDYDIQEWTNVFTIIRSQEIPEINRELINSNKQEVNELYRQAMQQKNEKKLRTAFKTISNAIKLAPNNADLYSLSAEILLALFISENPDAVSQPSLFDFDKSDDWYLLMDDLKTSIKLKPSNFAAYYLRANAFLIKQENKKARGDLEKVLEFISQNPKYETEIKQLMEKAK
ncbi:MAG: tetratricopeptide repeat protein [Chitinophagales bacterium]|nr:tetratricopeptide repeat protein [Chitinophagales bacterium]